MKQITFSFLAAPHKYPLLAPTSTVPVRSPLSESHSLSCTLFKSIFLFLYNRTRAKNVLYLFEILSALDSN